MPRYEYRTLLLEQVEARTERCFRWQCHGGGGTVGHRDVCHLLNSFGRDGWRVVAQDTDGRLGGTIILERQLPEDEPVPSEAPGAAPVRRQKAAIPLSSPSFTYDLSPLLAEIKALREQVARQAPPVVNVPPQTAPVVNFDALLPVLEELRSLRTREALSPDCVDRLAAAVTAAMETALTPRIVPAEPERVRGWSAVRGWFGFARQGA